MDGSPKKPVGEWREWREWRGQNLRLRRPGGGSESEEEREEEKSDAPLDSDSGLRCFGRTFICRAILQNFNFILTYTYFRTRREREGG